MRMRRSSLVIVFLAAGWPALLGAQTAQPALPNANPARPSVATPADLTPVGYAQFETGFNGAMQSPGLSEQQGLNEVAKVTVLPRLQVLVSTNPLGRTRSAGQVDHAAGGVMVGAQAVVAQGKGARPTFAVAFYQSVYDGGVPDLDIGSPDQSLQLLASADVRGFHYDANAIFNAVSDGGIKRPEFGQAFAVSHTLRGAWALTGEIWHFTQPFLHGDALGNLWALSYRARPNLVFDAGFNRGLTSTSTHWEYFAGFTYVIPFKLWK